jgi:hypothetical protein
LVREDFAKSLSAARERMSWEILPGSFALLGFPELPLEADLSALGEGPAQIVREGGETTLLVREEALEQALARHPRARAERDLCWIRFRVPMDWEVVGFLALVTGELASAGIPLGAVCGYSRDHLFLSRRFLEPAREVLARLFPSSRREPAP